MVDLNQCLKSSFYLPWFFLFVASGAFPCVRQAFEEPNATSHCCLSLAVVALMYIYCSGGNFKLIRRASPTWAVEYWEILTVKKICIIGRKRKEEQGWVDSELREWESIFSGSVIWKPRLTCNITASHFHRSSTPQFNIILRLIIGQHTKIQDKPSQLPT